ncbi:MAG: hypothetical protein ACXAC7_08655 [Candidatus Hodarchaeales archaeon]|jgi:hypothetical protein
MSKENDSEIELFAQYQSNIRKVLLSTSLVIVWVIVFLYFILDEDEVGAISLSLSAISILIEQAILVTFIGFLLVGFFIISDLYIHLSIDPLAFSKIEFCVNEYKEKKDFLFFIRRLIHFPQIPEKNLVPIPKSEIFTISFLGIYYLINFFGILLITEILFFTLATTAGEGFTLGGKDEQKFLPILAVSLIVGGKVVSLFHEYAREYGQMLTETLYIFLLFGIINFIHGIGTKTFSDVLPQEHAQELYLTYAIYLAMIPVIVEIGKWFLHLQRHKVEPITLEIDESQSNDKKINENSK